MTGNVYPLFPQSVSYEPQAIHFCPRCSSANIRVGLEMLDGCVEVSDVYCADCFKEHGGLKRAKQPFWFVVENGVLNPMQIVEER